MAEDNKGMSADERRRRLLTGQQVETTKLTGAERFNAREGRIGAETARQGAAAASERLQLRDRNKKTDAQLDRISTQLNGVLADIRPEIHGRFSQGMDSTQFGPELFFGAPSGSDVAPEVLQAEIARVKHAIDMVDTARSLHVVKEIIDGKTLRITPVGGKAASFPHLNARDVKTCLNADDAGAYLEMCVSIDERHRRAHVPNPPFTGVGLWTQFRKDHPTLTTVDDVALGNVDFATYDLSGLTFGAGVLLPNTRFADSIITGADFSRVPGVLSEQFDGAGGDANTKYPTFVTAGKATGQQPTDRHVGQGVSVPLSAGMKAHRAQAAAGGDGKDPNAKYVDPKVRDALSRWGIDPDGDDSPPTHKR